jgi:PQQ-dependent dehydrogenase (methanol/ethanol family)
MTHVTPLNRPWLVVALGILLATWVATAQQGRPVTDAVLRTAANTGEEWLTYGLDLGEKRFSPLSQINATNVSRLGLAWSYDIPATFGNPPGGGNQEATPLMWNGTLYGITTWSVVFAVDARTGKELWTWDPQVNRPAVQPKICCGIVNRGVAIYEGKIIAPIIDGRLVALDARTGKPVWESRVAYPQEQYTLTMAPRIAKGKVIIGGSGAEYPVRGFVDGYNATTGQRAWRFYTVPGDPAKGFENETMRKAAETWDGEWWKMGGGATVWDSLAYDADADLIYFGTGNGGPWPEPLRGSKGRDNLFVCSIIALRPDTGEMRWYYQNVPGDSWDYDSTQQLTLADLTINGQQRRVIMQANKNGFFYVLDRRTGALISTGPFAQLNWATAVDPETGRPLVRPEAYYGSSQPVTITPGAVGAHNWSPMSFNPKTGLMYIPASLGTSTTYTVNPEFKYVEGGRNTGTGRGGGGRGTGPGDPVPPVPAGLAPAIVPPSIGPVRQLERGGILVAWDPIAQKERWHKSGGGSTGSGTVTTAGNLVFQTVTDGRLLGYAADTGEQLLEIQTGQRSGMGPPMTYSLDGRQYVTLLGGRGAGAGPQGGGRGAGAPGAEQAPAVGQPAGAAPAAPAGPPAAAGQAPGGGGRGGPALPGVRPRMLTFVLDGKTPLPEQP